MIKNSALCIFYLNELKITFSILFCIIWITFLITLLDVLLHYNLQIPCFMQYLKKKWSFKSDTSLLLIEICHKENWNLSKSRKKTIKKT